MSYNSFIPQIWAATILTVLQKKHVYRTLTNEDYKRDAQNGDSVIINQLSNPTISTYNRTTGVTFETLQTTGQTMKLDQEKTFSYKIDDVDYVQSANGGALMAAAMQGAGYGWSDTIDVALGAEYSNAGITGGSGASALGTNSVSLEITADGGGTSTKIVDWLGALNRRYGESDAPDELERFLIVPYWVQQKMITAKILDYRGIDNNGTYENGRITKCFGFTLKCSNNVSNDGTNYRVMGGNRNCITFADQIKKIKAGERDEFFEEYVAGLYTYGYKTVRSDQLLCSYVYEGTEGQ